MKLPFIIAAFALIGALPGCSPTSQKPLVRRTWLRQTDLSTAIDTSIEMPPSITIWIHGTRLLPKSLFKNFFYSKPGLHHYTELESNYHQHKIAQILIDSSPARFQPQTFYLFGWNGKLSFLEREQAARQLYNDLKILRQEYIKNYGIQPVIRIVAHSHGGNVALLLEKVKESADSALLINELILLATPAQAQTMHYAHSPLFAKVYSLYSILDILQVIDPQGLNREIKAPLFSGRLLPRHEKIDQVAIKINDRSIMHIEFVKLSFLATLGTILADIDQWRQSSRLCAHDWANRNKCLCINTKKVSDQPSRLARRFIS